MSAGEQTSYSLRSLYCFVGMLHRRGCLSYFDGLFQVEGLAVGSVAASDLAGVKLVA
jgi:hypothetical protein